MIEPLTAVVILFGAALVIAWLMRALKAPSILGFIVAGVVIGPSGLNLIPDDDQHHQVRFFAELGLMLLLFTIGLELSPAPLLRMGRRLLAAAGIQIGLTTAACVALLVPLLGLNWSAGLIAGVGVSLSSTAIVLKHLSERGETDTPAGALTTGILLIQDIAVVVVLIALPLLAAATGAGWDRVVLRATMALGGLVVVVALARLVLPGVVNMVFRFGGQELTTLFAIVMACLGAWLASLANWSWPLGSFVAGLLLAQTDLRHQLHAETTPFRDALNALFFISIGMLVKIGVFAEHPWVMVLAILATLLVKAVLTAGAVMVAGWPLRLALAGGIGLCTISEFGYVLVKEASKLGMVPADFVPLFVAWAVGTMLVGALFVPMAGSIAAALAGRFQRHGDARPPTEGTAARASHVIVIGYGINGRNLAAVLKATRIPHVVIEMHRGTAQRARQGGSEVIVGDAVRLAILRSAGLMTARALVVSIADQQVTRRIVAQAHNARPDLYILARTRYISELDTLYRLGARDVIPEEFETSIEIFAHVLKEFAVPDNVIAQQVNLVRAGHYGMLRGRTIADRKIRVEWLQMLEAAVTQTYLLLERSPAAGSTIRELNLRARTGVTVVAVTRAGKATPSPPPDFRLEVGDVLVLVGTHHQLDEARAALEPPLSEQQTSPEHRSADGTA